jgi:hypothetical protein
MTKRLLFVDFENVQRVDLSQLDESYSAIVFLGATQNAPKDATNKNTAHRFRRVTFQKVSGNGKNALDFHIAFQVGRVFETSPKTVCFVVSRDKGFDPLVTHVNKAGLNCRRVGSFDELVGLVCSRCNKDATIDHNGGRWCSNCGEFAVEPDPKLAPKTRQAVHGSTVSPFGGQKVEVTCGWCHQLGEISDGLFDEGEWMCGNCMSGQQDAFDNPAE